MGKRIRARLTYANVTATIALFLALAGGTTAIALSGKNSVKKGDIAKNAVRAREIVKGAVAAGEVKNETLFGPDIGAGAIGASEIADGAVGATEIGSGAVGTAEQADVPVARIQREAALTTTVNNLVVPVPFDTESSSDTFDPFDMWSSGDAQNVIAPVDGVYLAVGEVDWASDDTNVAGEPGDRGHREIRLSAPGIGLFANSRIEATRFNTERTDQQASGIVNLQAGDGISVAVVQSNEDSSTVNANEVTLQVIWLGPGV